MISFPENGSWIPSFVGPVVIVDPICDSNNVASRISEAERKGIVETACAAWETANFASVENDDAVWKEVFGPKFRTEDQ